MNYLIALLTLIALGLVVFLWPKKPHTDAAGHHGPAHAPAGHHGPAEKSMEDRLLEFVFKVFILIILFGAGSCSYKMYRVATEEAPRVVYLAPQAPVVTGPERKLYAFDNDCVEVYLGGKWSSYPKGGKIKFIDTRTGKTVHEDAPGTTSNIALSPGWYRICPAESKATGVEIWQ